MIDQCLEIEFKALVLHEVRLLVEQQHHSGLIGMRECNKAIAKVLSVIFVPHLDEFLQITLRELTLFDHSAPSLLISGRKLVLADHA
jgi:hypothetical protein